MPDLNNQATSRDHAAFLEKALKRKGFKPVYDELEDEYALIRELLLARSRAGLTQEAVAERMGTTESAVSRSEGAGRHSPSVSTLKSYAQDVGCRLDIRLVSAAKAAKARKTASRTRASQKRVR